MHTDITILGQNKGKAIPGRGLCDELITRPEESYRLCCVVL